MRVIPRALPQNILLVDARPHPSAVVGAEQPAVRRLHQRPHALRIGRRDRDADSPQHPARHPRRPRNFIPCIAAVRALEQAAPRSAAIHAPRLAADLPEARIQHPRIARVHRQVHRARLVVALQNLLPGRAAVRRPVHAAHLVRPPQVPHRRHVDDVGILRVDPDRTDVIAILQPHVLPRAPRIHRFVDPVAMRRIPAHARLAHSRVHHVRIGIGHRDRTHRPRLELPVRHRNPRESAVGGLKDPAAHRAEIIHVRLRCDAGHGHGAPSPERSHLPELQFLHQVRRLPHQQQWTQK